MASTRDALRAALKDLLERLEAIGSSHEELFDSEVREAMRASIMRGFVEADPAHDPPAAYGLFAPEANAAVRSALRTYVTAALAAAKNAGLDVPARLAAFQDETVSTDGDRQFYDDFFGWTGGDE